MTLIRMTDSAYLIEFLSGQYIVSAGDLVKCIKPAHGRQFGARLRNEEGEIVGFALLSLLPAADKTICELDYITLSNKVNGVKYLVKLKKEVLERIPSISKFTGTRVTGLSRGRRDRK